MARYRLFRDVEVVSDEHGFGHLCRVPVRIIPQHEGLTPRVLCTMGTAIECDDFHINLLFESKLRTVEKVL